MKRILTILIFTSLLVLPEILKGQADPLAPTVNRTTILAGPVFGYNRSIHSNNTSAVQGDPGSDAGTNCPTYSGGSLNGFYIGGSFEYLLGGNVNSTSSIIFKATYSTMPSRFEQGGTDLPTRIQNQDGTTQIVETSVNHINEVSYSVIAVEALYKFNLGSSGFGLVAGPSFDLALARDEDERMSLVKPDNVQFLVDQEELDAFKQGARYANGNRDIIFSEGEIANSSMFRLGLKLGAQYEIINLIDKAIVVPHIFYNLGLNNLSPDEDWRVSALQLGVDIRFAF